METTDKIKYWNWCADKYWQYQRRQEWAYAWHGDTLVRFHELAMPDPDFTEGLLAWLKKPESVHGFVDGEMEYGGCTVYNRPAALSEEWKPVSAWYEQQEGQIDERTKLKVIRVYQALQRNPGNAGEDGPYVMENGCMQKLSFTYHWKVAELPKVPESESGVTYRLGGVSKDDETGLWSCYLEKRERVVQEVPEYTSENTGFATRTERQFIGVKQADVAGTGKDAGAGGGVTVRRRVKKNEDCTSDVTIETVVDKPVKEASVTVERTLRATTTVTEERNMSTPLSKTNLKPGTRVRNEKTEAGLYNTQKTEVVATPPDGSIKEVCRKTLFEHLHSETEILASRPKSVEVANVSLGDGKTLEMSVRQLEDATFEKETTVRSEKKVEAAVVETRKTLRGIRKIIVNRSMDAPADEGRMKIGDSVRSEKTQGGKYDQTIETTEDTPVGVIDRSEQESELKRVTKITENVVAMPNAPVVAEKGRVKTREIRTTENDTYDVTEIVESAKPAEKKIVAGSELVTETRTEHANKENINIPDASVNVEISAQVRKNEYGLEDGTVVERRHKPKNATVTADSEARTVEITIEKNAEELQNESAGVNEEVEIDISINDHGSYNVRKRKVTHKEISASGSYESVLASVQTVEKENSTEEEQSEGSSKGTIVEVQNSPNGHGSFRTRKTTRTAKAVSESVTWKTNDDNYEYNHTLIVYRNQQSVPTPPSNAFRCSVSISINEYGLYDVVINSETRTAKRNGSETEGQIKTGTVYRWMSYQKKDGTLCKRKVTANFKIRTTTGAPLDASILDGTESGFGFKSEYSGRTAIAYSDISVGEEKEIK